MATVRLKSRIMTSRPPAVVACVLHSDGQVCLIQRSESVSSDPGKWHCVTGYLPPGRSPLETALAEIREETGLQSHQMRLLDGPETLQLKGDGKVWTVHVFHFEVYTVRLQLNWENSRYQWLTRDQVSSLDCVPWLHHVLDSDGAVDRSIQDRSSDTSSIAKVGGGTGKRAG